jgi:RNA polymerase sigma-70 factor (ECF subfamily)
VREAIRDLTPDHRAVILLRELEGLSYAEISQVLECPKGTVMSRLHYARRQLQRRLRELL